MIGWKNEAVGVRIVVKQHPRGIGDAGGGVTTAGFRQHVVGGYFRKDGTGGIGGGCRGHHPETIRRNQWEDSVNGGAEKSLLGRQREKLLGALPA
jgi:hypothetical protein